MDNQNKIKQYYKDLDRSLFMENYKENSDVDLPFSIGFGQTISQPSLVLKMTLLLDPRENSEVLEIGTGSGYQTALLSMSSKKVYTVETIQELYTSAIKRLDKLGYNNIKYKLGDGHFGWSEYGPYDRIMVTAAAKEIPIDLINQLAKNGRMIITVKSDFAQDLLLVTKDSNGVISEKFISKVRFVDLV